MHYPSSLIFLFLSATTTILATPIPKPLNINMGAYSPALVVGDGAIGFKGAESVTQIMNTLQGAAASSAAANGAPNAAPAGGAAAGGATKAEGVVQAEGIQQAGVISEIPSTTTTPEVVSTQGELPQGMGKKVVTARDEDAVVLTSEEIDEIDEEVEEEDDE